MKNHIKVSAILPNYNMVEFLPRSIQSLLDQTISFNEIIIVDDGSTDDSIATIMLFMKKNKHVRLIRHEKNQGVNASLNTGIKEAKGDYILLCAADDFYSPTIVALATPIMEKFPKIGIICGDGIIYQFDLKKPFYRMLPYPSGQWISPDEFRMISKKSHVGFNGGGSMFINRDAILNASLIQLELCWHSDWLLYFVIAFRNGIYYINRVFIHIYVRKNSYSGGIQNKKIQNKVMLDTLRIIHSRYLDLWNHFKGAALLPHYAIRYVIIFFFDKTARHFFTIKLLWKLIIHNAITVRIGRLFPYRIILSVKKRLKINF